MALSNDTVKLLLYTEWTPYVLSELLMSVSGPAMP